MVATVESAFVLIDRASGPIRGIRRELRELEAEARAAGRALDDLSGPNAGRQLGRTSDEMHGLGDETHRTGQEMHRTEREVHVLDRRVEHLGTTSRKSGLELKALGKTVGLLKVPAAIAAVGGLTQVVGGLASGALAAAPAVGRVTTASAAAIPVMAGLGVSMGTAKLATQGMSKALDGNEKALKALTPEGRAFLEVLRSMQPEVSRLQRTAQRGLFPGLTDGLGDVRSAMPTVRRIVGQNSRDMGNLARFGGQQISANTSQGRQELRDLTELADIGSRALGSLGRSGVYAGRALTSVGVAAGPLTDWLGTSVERFAKNTAETAYLAQETGRLGRTFDHARDDLERFGDIGGHVFGALRGGMRAASGAGDDLWDSIDHGAESWDKWMSSVEGQAAMRRWFDDTKPALKETVGLVGDLGEMVGHLSSGPEGASMLRALRDAMPSIEKGVGSLTTSLGPAAVGALGDVVELAGDLAGEAGPLTLVARAVGTTASAADDLLQASGPLGPALATAVGSFVLLKKLGMFRVLDGIKSRWQGITVAEEQAAAAARIYGTTPVGGPGGAPVYGPSGRPALAGGGARGAAAAGGMGAGETALLAGGAGYAASRVLGRGVPGNPIGKVPTELGAGGRVMTAGGIELPIGGPAARAAGAGAANGGVGLLARARGMMGSGAATGALGRGAATAGRYAWPLALGMGVFGALGTEGNALDKLQGGLSAGTAGIISAPVSDSQKATAGGKYAAGVVENLSTKNSADGQRKTIAGLERQIQMLPGTDSFDQNDANLAAANGILKKELKRRQDILTESLRAQREALKTESVQNATALTDDFATAFRVRAKAQGPEKAMDVTVSGVLRKMKGMNPAGRKVLGENMLAWAREQARQNPALQGEYDRLRSRIARSFRRTGRDVSIVNGEILTGSRREWRDIRTALTTQTERARQDVSDDFTAMQRAALGSLTSMGFSRSDAKKLVSDVEKGGKAGKRAGAIASSGVEGAGGRHESVATREKGMRARGGRMPGFGRHDTVPMADGGWGAPGELVVNGHSERDDDAAKRAVNGLLGKLGVPFKLPTIAERVAAETRPHSLAPTRATGGRVGGVQAGIATAAEKVLSRFPGLSITSTTGGGHADGSYHYKGQAVDIGGPVDTMNAAASWIQGSMGASLTEGIHNPNLSIKNGQTVPSSFWGPATWSGHANHIHLAIAGALGALQGIAGGGGAADGMGAMAIPALKSRGSSVGGLPGAAATAAGGLYAAGLTKKINKALGSMGGGGGGDLSGFSGGGTSGANQTLGRKMMLAAGWGPDQWPALKALWTGESNWDSGAVNASSGAGGIPQALPATKMGPRGAGESPSTQIAWGLRYIKDRYGSPSGALSAWQGRSPHWYATGGRMGPAAPDWGGWNAKGGDYEVNRPTLFGAGEAGAERVTITPKGRGGASKVVVSPQVSITVNGGGASHRLRALVDRRIDVHMNRFAREIAAELDGDVEEDATELMV